MEFDDLIRTRKSIRSFSNEEIPAEILQKMFKAAQSAPSAQNKQCWRFVVVKADEQRKKLENKNIALAKESFRILALAYKKDVEDDNNLEEEVKNNLVFLGFAAMMDPPRKDVKESIAIASKAGIRTVMVTGDQHETAIGIAKDIGIEVDEEIVETIKQTKEGKGRVIAVGTTVTRALETAAQSGELNKFKGWTDIFIYPGYEFKAIDALITNFHLPKSTLLMMISALADKEKIFNAYEKAIEKEYRFYSLGDAMFIY